MSDELARARSALAQGTLGVLFLALLIGGALWVLRPFIGPAIWAAMIVVATWPLMRRIQGLLGGRRAPATLLMTIGLLLLFVVPLSMAIGTIVGNADTLVGWARAVASFRMAEPPPWLASLPMVGPALAGLWEQLVAAGIDGAFERLAPYAGNFTRWFVSEVGSVGYLLVQFLLTVGLAAVMFQQGESWAETVLRVGRRLGGRRGEHIVELAGAAVRGVALGVGVTAVVQAGLGGIALAIAGVPFAGLLTAVMVMLCLAQIGPLPVLLAATGWLFWQGQTGWGLFLLVASAIVGTLDNFIRPVLIRMGADLPLLLILAGVIGGLFAFGLVGIFVGPVVLAVAWTLLAAWTSDDDELAPGSEPPPGAPDARAHSDPSAATADPPATTPPG
ncbi:MAG: AI-2E family transporter YdiK [Burkholderiaceae bacterium]|nr:AI-2E family transporter YdiK [Burkholderiaceae bacterium]